jgi:hypothetical protein
MCNVLNQARFFSSVSEEEEEEREDEDEEGTVKHRS